MKLYKDQFKEYQIIFTKKKPCNFKKPVENVESQKLPLYLW